MNSELGFAVVWHAPRFGNWVFGNWEIGKWKMKRRGTLVLNYSITRLPNYPITKSSMPASDHFPNLVLKNGLYDFLCVLFAFQECFSKMDRLFELDLPGQRWFVLVHDGFDHRRTVVPKSFPKHTFSVLWIMNGETSRARGLARISRSRSAEDLRQTRDYRRGPSAPI